MVLSSCLILSCVFIFSHSLIEEPNSSTLSSSPDNLHCILSILLVRLPVCFLIGLLSFSTTLHFSLRVFFSICISLPNSVFKFGIVFIISFSCRFVLFLDRNWVLSFNNLNELPICVFFKLTEFFDNA